LAAAEAALAIPALAILVAWVLIAVVHVTDRFQLTHVGGARMALAQYAAHHAALYPPLVDGGFFGGTRFMPLPIALHALMARVTGEYLASGKLVSYLAMAALLATVYLALRRVGCPRGVAAAFTSVILLTQAGFEVGTGIYADAIPVVLQLGAILVVMSGRRWRLPLAASLCALALFSKQSALWGPAAIVLWLLLRDRRSALKFGGAFAGSTAVLFGIADLVTHGRILSVVAMTFSGELGNGVSRSLTALGWFPIGAIPWAILMPFAVYALATSLRRRRVTIYQLALVAAFAILLVILSDVGTSWNHSLDVVVLASLVGGELWGTDRDPPTPSWIRGTGVATIALAVALSSILVVGRPAAHAIRSALGGPSPRSIAVPPLAQYVDPGDAVLSQDPSIPVLYGRRPVIEDPFMLLRVGRAHPRWVAPLVQSIRDQRFDEVVLMQRIDTAPRWYFSQWEMGTPVIRAVRDAYRLEARAEGYYVYVPRT
jgi:hypothetical protein